MNSVPGQEQSPSDKPEVVSSKPIDNSNPPYILRSHKPGDMELITRRQGEIYLQEYGWNSDYEKLVGEISTAFEKNFNPDYERSWIAERDGELVGSVMVVRINDEIAKLRLLYVDPSTRGLGLGKRLVDECISFAREKGYKTLTLWTNSVLVSARKIYIATGFKLVKEEPNHMFGKDLVAQYWDLDL